MGIDSNNTEANWAKTLLSSDISYVLKIYDLIEQILDPCSIITDHVDSTDNLHIVKESIITQTVAIYLSLVSYVWSCL